MVATWSVLVSVEALLTSLHAESISHRTLRQAILGPMTENHVNSPLITASCGGPVVFTPASPVFTTVRFTASPSVRSVRKSHSSDRMHCSIAETLQCWSLVLRKTTNTPQRGSECRDMATSATARKKVTTIKHNNDVR